LPGGRCVNRGRHFIFSSFTPDGYLVGFNLFHPQYVNVRPTDKPDKKQNSELGGITPIDTGIDKLFQEILFGAITGAKAEGRMQKSKRDALALQRVAGN
jgi:hypothetical protein